MTSDSVRPREAGATALRIVCLTPYPEVAPSTRHRVAALRPLWRGEGIELTIWPFMSERFYRARRTFGALATLRKAAWFLASTVQLLARIPRLRTFDRIIIHREVFPLGPPVFETLVCRLGPPTFFDVDDAIWHPPSNPVHQRSRFLDPERVPKILRACSAVVAGNEYIARFARQHNPDVSVIPTTYDDPEPTAECSNHELPTVVWIGNLGNAEYLESILPALEAVHRETPFRLRLVGGIDIESIRSPVLDIERLAWRRDLEDQWLMESSLGIMPLHAKDFEKGKCAFKIIQYFAAGIPAVATPIGMNIEVIRQVENGFLASTVDDWSSAIGKLLADRELRERMAAAARSTYLERFTRRRAVEGWRKILRSETTD